MVRESFTWMCPVGHQAEASFDAGGIERLKKDVESGTVALPCVQCGRTYALHWSTLSSIEAWIDHVERMRKRRRD